MWGEAQMTEKEIYRSVHFFERLSCFFACSTVTKSIFGRPLLGKLHYQRALTGYIDPQNKGRQRQ
jgi:hypothetical protein